MRTSCAPWSTVHADGRLGLGVDRLIMLLAGEQDPERPGTVVRQPGIRETILFRS